MEIEHVTGNKYNPMKRPHSNYILKLSSSMHEREKEPENDDRGIKCLREGFRGEQKALDFNWIKTCIESRTVGDQAVLVESLVY